MSDLEIVINPELACHYDVIEKLSATAFGPGRFTRTAFRLREGVLPENELSFVALYKGYLVGSVRVTRVIIGADLALVLGPLVVDPEYKNAGIGKKLMQQSVSASKELGYQLIILVGDEPYYKPFGFKKVNPGQITLPGPVDPTRFLYCELQDKAMTQYSGQVKTYSVSFGLRSNRASGNSS